MICAKKKPPFPGDEEFVIGKKWRGKDIREFVHMWECDLALKDIARGWPERTYEDVVFLREYALQRGWIKERPSGLWGRRKRGA